MEKLDHMPLDLDVVFLEYSHCQALQGLPQQVKVPMVMMEYDGRIDAMLGTEWYHHEKNNGGITRFYPAG